MSTECSVCPIKKLFAGDEYDMYRNMLDLTYLGGVSRKFVCVFERYLSYKETYRLQFNICEI